MEQTNRWDLEAVGTPIGCLEWLSAALAVAQSWEVTLSH